MVLPSHGLLSFLPHSAIDNDNGVYRLAICQTLSSECLFLCQARACLRHASDLFMDFLFVSASSIPTIIYGTVTVLICRFVFMVSLELCIYSTVFLWHCPVPQSTYRIGNIVYTLELSASTPTSGGLQPRARGNGAEWQNKGRNISCKNGSLQRKPRLDYDMQWYART